MSPLSRRNRWRAAQPGASPDQERMSARDLHRRGMGEARGRVVSGSPYSGWKTAMVFSSGSLNQAERPMPGEVTMWTMVLNVSMSVDRKRTWV